MHEATELPRVIAATPERVFAALSDAWLFPVWVVGATHVRNVDDSWPQPGSAMYHQVGAWPISISDATRVVVYEPPTRMVMQAGLYPFGQARVELTVTPTDGGSLVRMAERPTHGLGRLIDNPVQRRLLRARNRESLDRLAALAENRKELSQRQPHAPGPGQR